MTIVTETEMAVEPAVAHFIEKMRQVEREAAQAWGPFNLFGLFEQEDTPDRWDVVVSAHWLKPGHEGILTIANYITAHLTPEEAVLIARIVPLPPESDFIRAVTRIAKNIHEDFVSTGPLRLGIGEIERGYVLASQSS